MRHVAFVVKLGIFCSLCRRMSVFWTKSFDGLWNVWDRNAMPKKITKCDHWNRPNLSRKSSRVANTCRDETAPDI